MRMYTDLDHQIVDFPSSLIFDVYGKTADSSSVLEQLPIEGGVEGNLPSFLCPSSQSLQKINFNTESCLVEDKPDYLTILPKP